MNQPKARALNTKKQDFRYCLNLSAADMSQSRRMAALDRVVSDIENKFVADFMKTREHTGKPRVVIQNGAWTSGCTSERPKGWEQMRGVKEVEAV